MKDLFTKNILLKLLALLLAVLLWVLARGYLLK
jgi:YbbR domain-containing protein